MLGPCLHGEPWKLLPTTRRGLEFSGWVNGGVMYNFHNNETSRNDPTAFSNPAGEFLMNQLWLSIDKAADGSNGWGLGYHVDFVFGADGPDTSSFGDGSFDFGWGTRGEYGSAMPQAYVELAAGDLSIKAGHFYTIMGYEVVQATGNFFYSHAYTMNFGEPFTHTGLLTEWNGIDDTTIWAGYTFGWDAGFENLSESHTFLGGIRRQLTEDIAASYTVNVGRYGNGIGPSGNLGDIFAHSFVLDVQLTEDVNYVFQTDLGINYGFGPLGNAEWYGINQYLFYKLNDCWQLGTRFEWFDDADGLRIATVNDGFNDLHYFGWTVGLNWRPNSNITLRPEFRVDWASSHSDGDFNDIFINNTRDSIGLFAIDFIMTF